VKTLDAVPLLHRLHVPHLVHGVGVWVGDREREVRETGEGERERKQVTSPWHSTPPPHTLGFMVWCDQVGYLQRLHVPHLHVPLSCQILTSFQVKLSDSH
jgi:hypothetical protein